MAPLTHDTEGGEWSAAIPRPLYAWVNVPALHWLNRLRYMEFIVAAHCWVLNIYVSYISNDSYVANSRVLLGTSKSVHALLTPY